MTKYNTIKEWLNNSAAYDTAFKYGWLDKCKAHMKTLSGNKKRLVYCVLFYNEKNLKSIFIDLMDFEDCLNRHLEDTFEALWYDVISEKELKGIKDDVLSKIESEFKRVLWEKIKIK